MKVKFIKCMDMEFEDVEVMNIHTDIELNKAIEESKYHADLTYKLCKKDTVYDFTENMEMFFFFF